MSFRAVSLLLVIAKMRKTPSKAARGVPCAGRSSVRYAGGEETLSPSRFEASTRRFRRVRRRTLAPFGARRYQRGWAALGALDPRTSGSRLGVGNPEARVCRGNGTDPEWVEGVWKPGDGRDLAGRKASQPLVVQRMTLEGPILSCHREKAVLHLGEWVAPAVDHLDIHRTGGGTTSSRAHVLVLLKRRSASQSATDTELSGLCPLFLSLASVIVSMRLPAVKGPMSGVPGVVEQYVYVLIYLYIFIYILYNYIYIYTRTLQGVPCLEAYR